MAQKVDIRDIPIPNKGVIIDECAIGILSPLSAKSPTPTRFVGHKSKLDTGLYLSATLSIESDRWGDTVDTINIFASWPFCSYDTLKRVLDVDIVPSYVADANLNQLRNGMTFL